MDEVRQLILEKADRINDIIRAYLPKPVGYEKTVCDAMEYSVMAPGKRLRPMLMEETYRLFGGQGEEIYPFMAAIEMIHTYSLIHDDLPAMDNDDYRRGRLTCHKKFGEDMAILAGDALLGYAYETACKSFDMVEDLTNAAKAVRVLAIKPGVYGMVGGQVVDVELTGSVPDEKQLEYIYENKTGALIEASMMIGAILAGADEKQIHLVEQIASDVGMAFQIQDDILDVTGDEAVIGKPVLSDEKSGKVTYVTIHGLDEARAKTLQLSERALSRLDEIGGEDSFLKSLITWLIDRDR
jgi:geranylgeranyl diphosphate synthase type II